MSAEFFDIDAIGSGPTELIRYRISSGERVLMASRWRGGVELWDRPASGEGPSYGTDRGFNDSAQLQSFVEGYERSATRLDAPPMSDEAWLELLDLDGLEELIRRGLGVS